MPPSLQQASKFNPPQLAGVLPRRRLLGLLRQSLARNLWVMTGQAAQGKSTLAASWAAQSGRAAAWLNLGPEDAPAENLFWALLNSLATALPGLALEELAGLAGLGQAPLSQSGQFLHLAHVVYSACPAGLPLVLDGLDRLPEKAPAEPLLAALVEALPPGWRLVLLGRSLPAWLPADQLLRRRALVLDNQTLACDQGEVAGVLALVSGGPVSPGLAARVHQLTEGWMGGVILAAQAEPGEQGSLGDSPLTGQAYERVFDFFSQVVFQRQEAAVREFLLACSPFSLLEPGAMAQLTGEQRAQEILQSLARRNFFISSLRGPDGARGFRFHQLFRDFLCARYREVTSPEAHRAFMAKAGEILLRRERREEALECLLEAGQTGPASGLVLELAPLGLRMGRNEEVAGWLSRLGERAVDQSPWLRLFRCLTRRFTAGPENARELPLLLETFERARDSAGRLMTFHLMIFNTFAMGASWKTLREQIVRAEEFLATLDPEKHQAEQAQLFCTLALVQTMRGSPSRGQVHAEQAYLLAKHLGDPLVLAEALATGLDALSLAGEFPLAEARSRELDQALQSLPTPALKVRAAIGNIFLHAAQGRPERAAPLVESSLALCLEHGLTFLMPAALLYDLVHKAFQTHGDPATVKLQRLVQYCERFPQNFFVLVGNALVAIWHARRAEHPKAWKTANRALREIEAGGGGALTNWGSAVAARALAGAGLGKPLEPLLDELALAADAMREEGSKLIQADCELALARLNHLAGRPERAALALSAGLDLCRECGFRFLLMHGAGGLADLLEIALQLGLEREGLFLQGLLLDCPRPELEDALQGLSARPGRPLKQAVARMRRISRRRQAQKLSLRTLGGLEARVGGRTLSHGDWGRKQARHLLAALLCLGPMAAPKETLMEALWPEAGQEAAEQNFKVTLHRLRKALEPGLDQAAGSVYLHLEDNLLRLDSQTVRLDLADRRELVEKADQAQEKGDLQQSLYLLEKAAGLWRGEFLADLAHLPWARDRARALAEEQAAILVRLAGLHEKRGAAARALAVYKRLAALDPWREEAYQNLMRLQMDLGLAGEAVRTFHACRRALASGLDAEPGWVTQSIYRKARSLAGRVS